MSTKKERMAMRMKLTAVAFSIKLRVTIPTLKKPAAQFTQLGLFVDGGIFF